LKSTNHRRSHNLMQITKLEGSQPTNVLPPINQQQPIEQGDPDFWDYTKDIAAAPFRGVEGAAHEVYDLLDWVAQDSLPDWEQDFLGTSETTAGKMVQGVSQFATGFIPVVGQVGKIGWLARAGKVGKVAKGAIAGAITDFTVFDHQEERLSNMIQDIPELANPVTEYLAADDNDGEIEGRLKNVLEGLGLGVAAEGLTMAAFRGLKRGRKGIAEGMTPDELVDVVEDGYKDLAKAPAAMVKSEAELAEIARKGNAELKADAQRAAGEEHGLLNPEYINSTDDMKEWLGYKRDAAIANKDIHTKQSMEETFVRAKAYKAALGLDDLDVDETLKAYRSGTLKTDEGMLIAIMAADQLPKQYDSMTKAIDLANKTGNPEDMIRAQEQMKMAGDLHRIIGGQRSAQGRALRSTRYLKEAEMKAFDMDELLEKAGGQDYLKKALKQFGEATDGVAKTKLLKAQLGSNGQLFRAHNELWMNSILSGPKTFAVNLMSSTINTFYRPLEGMVGAAVNGDLKASRAYVRQGFQIFSQISESAKFGWKSFLSDDNILDATSKVTDVISGSQQDRAISAKAFGVGEKTTKGHILNGFGKLVNLPTRSLMATDEFLKQINYRAHAKTMFVEDGLAKGLKGNDLAEYVTVNMDSAVTEGGRKFSEASVTKDAIMQADAAGMKGPARSKFIADEVKTKYNAKAGALPNLLKRTNQAQDFGRETTFTNPLAEGTLGRKLQTAVSQHPTLQLVMPFVRTPMNLLNFAGERVLPTKYGNFLGMHKKFIEQIEHADPMIRAQARGRQVMGASMMFSALGLVGNGIITGGGPTDPDERKILEATGWQAYSIKQGDTYTSYQRFDPFAMLFGSVADVHETFNRSDERMTEPLGAVIEGMQTALSQNVFNKSYLTGVQRLLDALNQDDTGKLEHIGKSQLASYIPNLITQSAGMITGEDHMREAHSMGEFLLKKVGATHKLEPTRNVLGEKVDARRYLTGNAASPILMSREKNDPVMSELAELGHKFTKPSSLVDGGQFDMLEYRDEDGRSAYDFYIARSGEAKLGGKTMKQALAKLIKSNYYDRLDAQGIPEEGIASPRVAEINRVMNRYRKAALEETYKEYPEFGKARKQHKISKGLIRQGKSAEQVSAFVALY
jgi:hypothetical protein